MNNWKSWNLPTLTLHTLSCPKKTLNSDLLIFNTNELANI